MRLTEPLAEAPVRPENGPTALEGAELTDADREFLDKRAAIAEAIKDDQKLREMFAEMYLFYANMDKAMRTLAANGGIRGMMKMMMGRGEG